ncbi:kelch-like protein 40a [Dendronephthya gigantea]|uniref:kelch-like protein 40a n=1 Tax=Dendronephthya gigantea TaxID=151771 RepID=UPI00106C1935|nr:kelch-like protein 40a [Dendronephthya gigantea]
MTQKQVNEQKKSNRRFEAGNKEMKKGLKEVAEQLERLTGEQEDIREAFARAVQPDEEPRIVIAGGWNDKSLNSVEMFSLSNAEWLPLQPMKQRRYLASSVSHNNETIVSGGFSDQANKSLEKLSLKAVYADSFIFWKYDPVELPKPLFGHCSVIFDGRLIVIGGYNHTAFIDNITEVSLVSPNTGKVLATMPESRWLHGAVLFGNTIVILGGRKDMRQWSNMKSVLSYDIVNNECHNLAPLPYAVDNMATVKWGSDNVIIIGGSDSDGKPLDKVLIYNVKTQKSQMLPDMKYKRQRCAAAVVSDTVIVMGGQDEGGNSLKSVESFRFDSFAWEELPEMQEARCGATAIVC